MSAPGVDVEALDREEINLELFSEELERDPEIQKLLRGVLQQTVVADMIVNTGGELARKVSDVSEQECDFQTCRGENLSDEVSVFSNNTAEAAAAEAKEIDPLTMYHEKEFLQALDGIVNHLRKNDNKRFVDLSDNGLRDLVLKGLKDRKFNPILPSPDVSPTHVVVLPGMWSGTIENAGRDKHCSRMSTGESGQQQYSSKKRGPYKLHYRESWTQEGNSKYKSTLLSCTMLLNEREQKRNPVKVFQERFVSVSAMGDAPADMDIVKEIKLEAEHHAKEQPSKVLYASTSHETDIPTIQEECEELDVAGQALKPAMESVTGDAASSGSSNTAEAMINVAALEVNNTATSILFNSNSLFYSGGNVKQAFHQSSTSLQSDTSETTSTMSLTSVTHKDRLDQSQEDAEGAPCAVHYDSDLDQIVFVAV